MLWHQGEQLLYWVDIKRPAVPAYDPATGAHRTWPKPEPIRFIVPRRKGGFIAGFRSGLAFLNIATASIEPLVAPEPDPPGIRCNDGACDNQGRLWAGTMDDAVRAPTGRLYRIDAEARCVSWRSSA